MPTTTKLLIRLLFIGLVIYSIMLLLIFWVKPVVAEMTVNIPAQEIELHPWPEVVETPPAPPPPAAVQKPKPAAAQKPKPARKPAGSK
ncbi:MAG: Hypothetical protein BHV28_01520 [Candidatus Tokpelaia hoelldobleri]|uniref:Uncharacterized protein n=1 Tax=Candidatus Tokpelaia hoelldobleri TaxID=1902579 RepID=A0A1U9JSN9_9HYPH|nr:MAG: Hypothetical protein BHV28_01520 [Candidatus Tokpelaia hoelldoblerii]